MMAFNHSLSFLSVSISDWKAIKTSKHQISMRLAERGHRVLYVEPSLQLTSLVHINNILLARSKVASWVRGGKQIMENLHVYCPLPVCPIPFHHIKISSASKLANTFNTYVAAHFLNQEIARDGLEKPFVLWFWGPLMVDLIKFVPNQLIIYHSGDDYSAFSGAPSITEAAEIELLKKADLVFAVSEKLQAKSRKVNKNTYLLPNAADVEHFATSRSFSSSVPQDLSAIPSPRIGFVGAIYDWVDLELLMKIAKEKPEWSIVMIGPVYTDVSKVRTLKNIYWFGRKEYGDLPKYLAGIDVAIIPFKMNHLTESADPIKLYEYLAAGKPVVSTNLPAVRRFEGVVKVASNYDEFVDCISAALKDDRDDVVNKRLEIAEQNSWQIRVDAILHLIYEQLKKKQEQSVYPKTGRL